MIANPKSRVRPQVVKAGVARKPKTAGATGGGGAARDGAIPPDRTERGKAGAASVPRDPRKNASRSRNAAIAVQSRKPRQIAFPTDAESIELRREGAAREAARVTRPAAEAANGYFGLFEVASAQWKEPYQVEIRSLTEPLNTCNCQDHRMNRLGTCKHVERVLLFLVQRGKRRFERAAAEGPPTYEVFFDVRHQPPQPRLLRPAQPSPAIERRLTRLFDAGGQALGAGLTIWPEIEAVIARCPPRLRSSIRLSRHAGYWLDRERRPVELQRQQARFDAGVTAGRRTDNPVRLPLYPYQKQGMRHLAFNGRALLADDMGLGKTVQAIAAAELLRQLGQVRRVLVVSPASLKTEWEEQLTQFTGIRAKLVFGLRPARLRIYAQEHPYTLCNYEQVRNDVDDINRLMLPDLVILDEAQRIKNWPTKTAKTIKRLQSPFAFVLTGTPLENRIEELYSLVEFVDPHVLGSLFRFQREFMELTPDNVVIPKNLDQLHRIVSTVMLRRRKNDVEDDLPARTDKNFFVGMTDEQRTRYGEFEVDAMQLAAIMKRRPLTKRELERLQILLGCMRMTCDTPYILDPTCRDCPKLEELESILDELLADVTTKVIVFSEWVRMLDLVRELLDAKGVGYAQHTGKIPQQQRRAEIKRFKQAADCRVFLSSESGGSGLNLQAANVVINLDLPWNPAKLEQRIARAWRKHQTRGVRVLNLVAENTIEHGMLGKLAYKTALADSVLDGVAFEPPAPSATGRRAFAERVSALLSGEPVQAPARPAAPAEDAADLVARLTARHADSVLGIERLAESGAHLVMARPGADPAALQAAAQAAGELQAVVLMPETRDLLLRLQAMGVLTLSSKLTTLHAVEGYTPLHSPPPAPDALHYDAARERWKSAASEFKAARTLAEIGLHAQATPHLMTVLCAGRGALIALYDSATDTLPDHAVPLHRKLMQDLGAYATDPPRDAGQFADALALAEDIGRALKTS